MERARTVLDAVRAPLTSCDLAKSGLTLVEQFVDDTFFCAVFEVFKGVLSAAIEPQHPSQKFKASTYLNNKGTGFMTRKTGPFSLQGLVDAAILIALVHQRHDGFPQNILFKDWRCGRRPGQLHDLRRIATFFAEDQEPSTHLAPDMRCVFID